MLTVLHSEPDTWDKHNQAYQALQVKSLVYGGKMTYTLLCCQNSTFETITIVVCLLSGMDG